MAILRNVGCFLRLKKLIVDVYCLHFHPQLQNSELGGRQGSNACTIISVKFGTYYFSYKLDVSLLWNELPQLWTGALISAVCDGNAMYMMTSFNSDTAVFLDVEDIAKSAGIECQVQSCDHIFGFRSFRHDNVLQQKKCIRPRN